MNYVAAMLLLCLDLSEERAFWVMVALIDDNGQSLSSHCAVKAGTPYVLLLLPLLFLSFVWPPSSITDLEAAVVVAICRVDIQMH